MSRGDLAFKMRDLSQSEVKPNERSIRGWERNENEPIGTAAVVAARAVGVDVEFFYESVGDDGEAEADMEAALHLRARASKQMGEAASALLEAAEIERRVRA